MTFKTTPQPEPEYAYLVVQLAARRQQLGLSQLTLDDIIGLPIGYSGKLESGVRIASVTTLCLWVRALGAHLSVVNEKNIPAILPPIERGRPSGAVGITARFRRLARHRPPRAGA
jgi:transcriptional regulator with XRE-family HTH domain